MFVVVTAKAQTVNLVYLDTKMAVTSVSRNEQGWEAIFGHSNVPFLEQASQFKSINVNGHIDVKDQGYFTSMQELQSSGYISSLLSKDVKISKENLFVSPATPIVSDMTQPIYSGLTSIDFVQQKSGATYFPLQNSSTVLKSFGATYSDYVVLPNAKANSGFEFHDHEVITNSGAIVNLSSTYLTSDFSALFPASSNNGANIIRSAIYKEEIYGSGVIPWVVLNAPSNDLGTSITLNTFSNLAKDNNIGAFAINTSNGNTFQLSTDNGGGFVGWKNVSNNMNITLSADVILATGQFAAQGNIKSKLGFIVGGENTSNVNITSTAITFLNSTTNNISAGSLYKSSGIYSRESFCIESRNTSGILLNTYSDDSNNSGIIGFTVNTRTIGVINQDGLVLGSDTGNPSSILTMSSNNKGFLPPVLTDSEIFNIKNPVEGLQVYSSEHHANVYFNGKEWRIITSTKKLKNQDSKRFL